MRALVGVLLLVTGVVLPLVMLFWLNSLLSRRPPPAGRRVGILVALNGLLPVGLILQGLGMLSPAVWSSPAVRTASYATLIASALLLVVLAAAAVGGRRGGGNGR